MRDLPIGSLLAMKRRVLYDLQTTESETHTEEERGSTKETRIGGSPRERRQRREDKREDAGRRSGEVKTDGGRKRSSCQALSGVKHHHKYNLIRSESAHTHTYTRACRHDLASVQYQCFCSKQSVTSASTFSAAKNCSDTLPWNYAQECFLTFQS